VALACSIVANDQNDLVIGGRLELQIGKNLPKDIFVSVDQRIPGGLDLEE
jgi:hypothetical protein